MAAVLTWIDPELAGPDLVLLGVLTLVPVVVAIRTGPQQYRRILEQLAGQPNGLVRLMRRGALVTWLLTFAALAIVGGAPGLTLTHLGLGGLDPAGSALTILAVLGIAGVQLGGAFQTARRRAAGGRVRGEALQRQVALLYPRTARERAWAAVLSVSVGVGEEVFFRGLLIAAAVGVGLPVWAAIVLPAVLFGLQHRYQTWRGVVFSTVFGLLMTLLYAATERLWTPIAVHAAWDLMALLVVPRILGTARVLDPTPAPAAPIPTQAPAEAAPPAGLPRLRSAAPE
ncbi:type II CAAX endopeptidase family protein [Dactylosporangium sp. AC04546]|uniref:CPBP family intramembrane glutamic endopeptidase n=1 Tax=Dactylosporangium sp. AC04546 TaxID=2862460 RepID=UPI001EE128AE|nr:type II CAAX endopeptidase family protein [Dactylosporangium sp. AC04546]WVK85487.1 type II CAAX endopeptidase family protein [Dactylosporangium sp. AC04546]